MKMELFSLKKSTGYTFMKQVLMARLNLYSLFNYLQDIASDHAVKLGFGRDDLMRENRFWVLSRMYAEIDRMAIMGRYQ